MRYEIDDVGCYADGVFGHEHVRTKLGLLLHDAYHRRPQWKYLVTVRDALFGPMSDDAQEEHDALSALNSRCDHGVRFELVDGDLMLVRTDGP